MLCLFRKDSHLPANNIALEMQLNEVDMSKKRCHVEIRLVRGAPATICLIGKSGVGCDRAEEVHTPLCALGTPLIDIKKSKRNLNVRSPLLVRLVEAGCSGQLVINQVGDIEAIEGRASGADLGRIVDEGREGYVVGGHLEFEVGLGVFRTPVLWWVSAFSLAL